MSIRWKLLWSYTAMLIIPVVLLVMISSVLLIAFRGDVQNLKSLYESKVEGLDESEYHHLLKRSILQNPALLTDSGYLDSLSGELSAHHSSVYIRQNGKPLYAGSAMETNPALLAGLPPYEGEGHHDAYRTKVDSDWYRIFQFDLAQQDGQQISFFMLTKIDPLVHFAQSFFPILFLSAIAVLILTNVLLTYYMSKHFIKPLMLLRKAADQFTVGNLEYQVEVTGKDEIGQLGNAFEQMRVRLLESIRMQLQYEANRKELVMNISHDLKTPITAIKGYVDGIMEGIADSPDKHAKYMRTIASKASEMDHLIDELFLFSKLDMKKLPVHLEEVPVDAMLEDWADDLRLELEKKDVALTTDFRVSHATAMIDRDSFKRVLGNVIQNSLKYMDKQEKKISLYAVADGSEMELVIEDNGRGIEAEAVPYIFERFYRAEQSRNSETGGNGLGLAIAKQIVLTHGGDIRAESVREVGTRIIITIPISQRTGDNHE